MTNHSKVIKGTSGDDQLQGTGADDILKGLAGNDRIFGKAGNDKLRGGNGDDQLNGDAGNDHLSGGNGDDQLNGGNGDDRLGGGNGDDQLNGGAGSDRLNGGAGNDALDGGAGNDRLNGGTGNNQLNGGAGYDIAGYNRANAAGPITFKYAFINTPPSRFNPFPAPTAGFQVVRSDGGVDTLNGIEQINGVARQANTIDFSDRRQVGDRGGVRGILQAPSIDVNLAKGELKILKDESTGRISGQGLLDQVTPKNLKLRNFVNVVGSAGEDRIVGNGKANRLEGGTDDDVIIGGGGDDTLIGGGNNDTLTGGRGNDKFVLTEFFQFIRSGPDVVTLSLPGISADTITDFERGDQIQLRQGDNFWGQGFDELALGEIGAEQFAVEGQDEITAATKLIYNGSSGELFYKPNEPVVNPFISRTPMERVRIATLTGAPTLQAHDIVVT